MKLLVTGGAGFIGSNFIRYWLNKYTNHHVVNYDALTYAGCLESLQDVADTFRDRYTFVKGDITDLPFVLQTMKSYSPDIVVNFAAETHNSRAILNPSKFVETNVLGTQRLLEAARHVGIKRFHHISTCEVYGDLPLDSNEKFTEESLYRPRTPYSASKAAAEMIVRGYFHTFRLPVTISNCSNNYGPYQFPEKLIPHFIIKGLRDEKMPLYRQSRNRREWIHVLDHCRGIDAILERGTIGETYNIGTEFEADIETIADTIIDLLGLNHSYKMYVEDRPGHDRRYLLDSSKIRNTLAWKPFINFNEGLAETVTWYKQHRQWWEPLFHRLDVQEDKWDT